MNRLHILFIFLIITFVSMASVETSYRFINVESGLSNNAIMDMEYDNFGFLWVATDEGLNIVSGNKVRTFFKTEGDIELPANELNCLLNDAGEGFMWIGTQREGIVGFNYETVRTFTFTKKLKRDITLQEMR